MPAIPLHSSSAYMRDLFLIHATERDKIYYGITKKHTETGHWCAYLNVDKETWLRVADAMRRYHDITFEGIGSAVLNIPNNLIDTFPIQFEDYWIGIDYFQKDPQPEQEQVLARLDSIANSPMWDI